MATLKMRKTDKSGATSYAIDGLKRSVYFNAGMFAEGKIPATVEISLPAGFAFSSPETAKAELAAAEKAAAAVATPPAPKTPKAPKAKK